MLKQEEIDEEYEVTGIEVATPSGMKRVTRVFKTVPLRVWRLETKAGYVLEASAHHLVRSEGEWVKIKNMAEGDLVDTEIGMDTVSKVEDTGRTEALYDISVDDPDHSFYSNGILSHNSTTICTRMLMNSHMLPGYQGLYIVPNAQQLKTTADRLWQMETRFAANVGTQNLYTKKYSNGSMIYMLHCGETANDARGKSSWEIIIDECAAYFTKLRVRYNEVLDTYVNICDIAVGSEVMSFDNNGNITYDRVTGKQFKGFRDCYRVSTHSRHGIVATANHKLRVRGGWAYVADIGRHNGLSTTPVREQYAKARWCGDVLEGQTCTCNAYRNPAWGRMSAESAVFLPLEEVFCEPLHGPGGLRIGEGASTFAAMPECEYHPEPWILRYVGGDPRNNEVESRACTVLGTLLHETCSEGGRFCQHDQVRYGGMGCRTDMGGRGLVDTGRRVAVWRTVHDIDAFVFGGGAGSAGCLDAWAWIEKGSVHSESCSPWKGVQYNKAEQDGVHKACRADKAVCASFHDVQGGCISVQRDMCVSGVREDVQGNRFEGEVYGTVWSCVLPYMLGSRAEASKGGIQEKAGDGGMQEALEGGKGCEQGKGQRVREELLHCEQGVHCRKGQGEKEGCCGNCREERTGSNVCVLSHCIQTDTCHVQGSGKGRGVCVYVQGMQETAQDSELGAMQVMTVDDDGTVRFSTAASVVYCGMEEVWDIETEKHHTYVADGIGSHNCQSMDPTIIPDILECNQMSPLPITLYTGTAMSTETLLEQEWQKSSQGVWHIKAGDGRTWLNMHDEDTLLKVCDNPRGPTCPITGKVLDVTDGHYEHMYPERLDRGYIGLHVPQVIIKDNVDNPLQWSKLYRKRQEYDTNKFLMECCGIAMAEGMREITQADLERMCDITADTDELLRRCNRGYYRLVVSGCDWGGSDYNQAAKTKTSYTVHCILGVAPNGMVDVLHFNRYAGMDYKSIGADIVKNHLKFRGNVIVSDFGVGSAYNAYIRENLPVFSHFIAQFTAPNTAPLAPIKNSNLTNHVGINKTEAITNVFSDVKRGRIHAMNWGKMEQYLMDFLNVYRAPVDTEQGMTKFRWIRNATKADDALMAFTFAYVFVKMYTGERLVEDKAFERYIMDVMNGHPGRSSTPPNNFNYVI